MASDKIFFPEGSLSDGSRDSAFSVLTDKSQSLGALNDFPKLSHSLCESHCDITGSNDSFSKSQRGHWDMCKERTVGLDLVCLLSYWNLIIYQVFIEYLLL